MDPDPVGSGTFWPSKIRIRGSELFLTQKSSKTLVNLILKVDKFDFSYILFPGIFNPFHFHYTELCIIDWYTGLVVGWGWLDIMYVHNWGKEIMDVLGSEEKPFLFLPGRWIRIRMDPYWLELLNPNPDPEPGAAKNLHLNFKTGSILQHLLTEH